MLRVAEQLAKMPVQGERIVNEQEWLAATDLVPMVDFLGQKASQRKLRLFAVTCCQWVTQLGTDTSFLNSLDVAERFADGAATADELAKAEEASNEVYQECEEALSVAASRAVLAGTSGQGDDPAITKRQDAADIVSQTTEAVIRGRDFAYTARGCGRRYTHSDPVLWLRDIFGIPFRPVIVDPDWLTTTVVSLARQMYESRDFSGMPILADALHDAGCDEPAILAHCRCEKPHVRGCWLVDLILGKG